MYLFRGFSPLPDGGLKPAQEKGLVEESATPR
jgi:hypothetical protein